MVVICSWLICFGWLCFAAFAGSATTMNSTDVVLVSMLLTGTTAFIACTMRYAAGRSFSLYGVTVGALIIFNASQALVLLVGGGGPEVRQYLLSTRFSPQEVAATFAVVGCYLSAFHVGGVVLGSWQPASPRNALLAPATSRYVAAFAVITFALSVPFAALQIIEVVQTALATGYFSLYDQSLIQTQSFAGTVAAFAVPMALVTLALGKGYTRTLALLFLLAYSCAMIAVGYRGWGALALIATAWTYRRCVGRLPTTALWAGAAAICVAFPMIGVLRNTPLQELTVQQLLDAYSSIESPFVTLLAEAGGSAATVAWTMYLVPNEVPFGWGISFLYSATSIFPNLFFELHPSAEHALGPWLTRRVAPEIAAVGGGMGYSFFAELYYNFGLIGGTPFALAAGCVVSWVSKLGESSRSSPVWIAIVGVLISFLPFYARADSSLLFRPLAWFIIAPCLVAWVLSTARNARRSQRPIAAGELGP